MSWECYVQLLKRMFEMTNYETAPLTVATFYSMKAVLHYRDPQRASWFEDVVEATSDFHTDWASISFTSRSVLARALTQTPTGIHALRFLSMVRRGREVIRINDWVTARTLRAGATQRIGQVMEMAQVVQDDAKRGTRISVVRIFLRNVREAQLIGGDPHVCATAKGAEMLIPFERMLVSPVVCAGAPAGPMSLRNLLLQVHVSRFRM